MIHCFIVRADSVATAYSPHIRDAPTDLVDDIFIRQNAELGGTVGMATARNHGQGNYLEGAPIHLIFWYDGTFKMI